MESPAAYKSRPSINSIPTEILTKIASLLTPTLARTWAPGSRGEQYTEWKKQHSTITCLQLSNRLFASICRPLVWKTLCLRKVQGTIIKMLLEDTKIQPMVKALRWEVSTANQLQPAQRLLSSLPNLDSLAILGSAPPGGRAVTLTSSFCSALKSARGLETLQLEGFEATADADLDLARLLPCLETYTTGCWWEQYDETPIPGQVQHLSYITDEDVAKPEFGGGVDYLSFVKTISVASRSQQAVEGDIERVFDSLGEVKLKTRKGFTIESIETSGYPIFQSTALLTVLELLAPCKVLQKLSFVDCPPGKIAEGMPEGWSTLQMPCITSLTIQLINRPVSSYTHPNGYPQLEIGTDLLLPILAAIPNLEHLDISNFLKPPLTPHSDEATLHDITAHTYIFLLHVRRETKINHLVIRYPTTNQILRFKRQKEEDESNRMYGFTCELWHEW